MELDVRDDIYFDPRLGCIHAELEGGSFEEFNLANDKGKIRHQFIVRPINIDLGDGKQWFDLTTPYGYGGPMVLESGSDKTSLVRSFEKAFSEYCEDHYIVSEFVRFHPIANNAVDFQTMYDIHLHNKTVGTNLRDFEDPFAEEFSKSARKTVRRVLKEGLRYSIEKGLGSIEDFMTIYYETMNRNEAGEGYYFPESYFVHLRDNLADSLLTGRVLHKDKTIAMSLCFHTEDILHVHLSGTLNDYLYLSPAYLLRYAYVGWGKENGVRVIHHGGGTTGAPDDSLYLFKKKFGQRTEFSYYIGNKIWDNDMYSQLIDRSISLQNEFFPLYRYKG